MVKAIAHETKSVVFDLSPMNIDGKFAENKASTDKMLAMVFRVAEEY